MLLKTEEADRAAINTKRLSAMIESFHDSTVDEILFMPRSTSSSPRIEGSYIPFNVHSSSGTVHGNTTDSKPIKVLTPAVSMSTNLDGISNLPAGNRESILSEYAASIHEGVPISYVVANNSVKDVREEPQLPELPIKGRKIPIGLVRSDNPGDSREIRVHNRLVHMASKLHYKKSLRLVSSQQLAQQSELSTSYEGGSDSGYSEIHSRNSDMRSVDTASSSSSTGRGTYAGSNSAPTEKEDLNVVHEDKAPPIRLTRSTPVRSINEDQNMNYSKRYESPANSRITTPLQLKRTPGTPEQAVIADNASGFSDMTSIASSLVPPLKTTVLLKRQQSGALPDRSITSDYHPTIPARNKNRPKSALFLQQGLDNIQKELIKEMDNTERDEFRRSRGNSHSAESKSELYFSAQDDTITVPASEDGESTGSNTKVFDDPEVDASYLSRPLPTIPAERKNQKSTKQFSAAVDSTVPLKLKPPQAVPSCQSAITEDDEWEDELIYKDSKAAKSSNISNTAYTARSKKHGTTGKGHKERSSKSLGVDAFTNLLNATKGTLIGSEFANLGIRAEEKLALERLVDSLSRLTADMIVDPERYAEGLRRLDKATKALDGF
ncbi:HBR163Wp [Eremothecium sinecaudum]|uniref:HBR163Wp n=1 Tax=Eremothecium sinecaudum TaxID=45286 RepID=A0A120K166_9SACH|nr:HBR163Wp [Eremothecium sinecaudum]AMD19064.1 HBR163Wp [Eremothecium sinecaudum]